MTIKLCGLDVLIDAEDFDRVTALKWHPITKDGLTYIKRTTWRKGRFKALFLHNFVFGNLANAHILDHRDGNTLNNQKSNLRVCTASQNAMNRKLRSDNKTAYKGVTIRKETGRFRVSISVDKRRINLGTFDTAEAAYAVYCEAAVKYHGEFARLK